MVDFWRLVWQEKPPTIVMVTNLKEGTKIKCQKYWPESGTRNFGPFQVTISEEQTLADYTTRTLLVQVCMCRVTISAFFKVDLILVLASKGLSATMQLGVYIIVGWFPGLVIVCGYSSCFDSLLENLITAAEGKFRACTEGDPVPLHSLA